MATPLVGNLLTTLGGATPAVTSAFSTGLFAGFGAIFAVNYSKLAVNVTNWVGSYMSGEKFNRPWAPEPVKEPVIQKIPQPEVTQEASPTRLFTAREKPRVANFETLVSQTNSEALLQR